MSAVGWNSSAEGCNARADWIQNGLLSLKGLDVLKRIHWAYNGSLR